MASTYAFVPLVVLKDERLTKIQLKVLWTLYSFINHKRPDQKLFPKRGTIGARCGYSEQTVSKATKDLEGLGWLVKANNSGGRSRGAVYYLRVPSHLTEAEQVTKPLLEPPQTLSESVRVSEDKTLSNSERVFKPEKLTKPELDTRARAFNQVWEQFPFQRGNKDSAFYEFLKKCQCKEAEEIDAYALSVITAAKQQKALIGERMHALSSVPLYAYLDKAYVQLDSIESLFLD